MVLDKNLSEISLETGLEAFQVVETRKSPGAAGTVVSIPHSLDVDVSAIGFTGEDGNGYDLRNGLVQRGVNIDFLSIFKDKFTPTYIKPMLFEKGTEHEISRLDIKNRKKLGFNNEGQIIESIEKILPMVDAFIIIDQVQEKNCGVVTENVLNMILRLTKNILTSIFLQIQENILVHLRM